MDTRSSRRFHPLAAWLFAVGLALAVAVLVGGNASATEESESPVEASVQLGAQLYAANCAQCHGAEGQGAVVPGSDREAPPIADSPKVTAAYVDLVMATGRMPPADSPFDNRPREVVYDEQQRASIVAFTVQEFGVEENLFAVGEGDAARGQELWQSNCMACHGATGSGGVAGAGAWTPTVYPLSAEAIAYAIRVGPFQMPAFDAGQLDDQEVADIAEFMHEVDSEEGTPLGLVELNPVFVSGFVAILALAMIASLFWVSGKPSWFPDVPEDEDPPTRLQVAGADPQPADPPPSGPGPEPKEARE